jgi:hypothetical protein
MLAAFSLMQNSSSSHAHSPDVTQRERNQFSILLGERNKIFILQ